MEAEPEQMESETSAQAAESDTATPADAAPGRSIGCYSHVLIRYGSFSEFFNDGIIIYFVYFFDSYSSGFTG